MLAVFLWSGIQLAMAQTRPVRGQVLDDQGEGLPGASVQVKGTSAGTITDLDGNFSIDVPDDHNTLVISAIGYGSQEVQAGDGGNILSIKLTVSSTALSETIVTALGIRRSEKSLGYSAQKVNADQLENARANNVLDAISGKVAGVRVNSQSGGLGGSSKIVIRGSSSLSGSSQPLIVVDGVPISNESQDPSSQGIIVDYGNRGGDINPDDIESMTVLKGPAATAQYGSMAKDGAIIITTKRGSKNAPLSVSVNSSFRVDNILVAPELQSEYAQGIYGQYNLRYSNGWGPKISDMQGTTVKDYLGRDVQLQAYPDNIKNFYQTGNTWMNDVSISGGDAKNDYRISFGALNTKGIVLNQALQRYNLGANVGHAFSDKVSSRFTFNYTSSTADGRPFQSSNNPSIITSSIYSIPVTVDVEDLKKNYQNELGEQNNLTTDKSGNNPFWILNKNRNGNKLNRFFGSAYLDYKPVSWLTISNNFGYDMYNEDRLSYVRQGTAGDLKGSYSTNNIFSKRFSNDLMITAQKDLDEDWNLKVMVGNNIMHRAFSSNQVVASNLMQDSLFRPSNAETALALQTFRNSRIISLYGEITASYRDMLYLTVTGRNDWSSALVYTGNYSYFYPSVTGSFIFSELMERNNTLSFGKVRASYARVGSDTDPYSTLVAYSPLSTYFVQYGLPGQFPYLGQGGFSVPRVLPESKLKPQIASSIEFGADLRFFEDRIGLDITYYNTKTKNQIINLDVPLSTGYFAKQINAGQITNKGVEAVLRLTPVRSRTRNGVNWDLMANISHNKQTVDELDGSLEYYAIQSGWSGLQIKAPVGGSFALYGTKWRRSPEGQFVINPNTGLREVDNDQYIGDINPTYLLGISNRVSYKGFSLGFLVDIRQGGVFFSGTVANLRASGMAKETVENRGQSFIDQGVNQLADGSYQPNTTPVQSMQDFWSRYSSAANTEGSVFDASFVKLREVTFSYAFPNNFTPFKNVIKGLEIGLEARNLWLIKSYVPHVDPELSYFGANSAGDGVEFNSFPSTRSFGINLKAKL